MALITCIISILNPVFSFAPVFVFLLLLVSDYLSGQDGIRNAVLSVSAVILVTGNLLGLACKPLSLSHAFLACMIWSIKFSSLIFSGRTEGFAFLVISLPLHLITIFIVDLHLRQVLCATGLGCLYFSIRKEQKVLFVWKHGDTRRLRFTGFFHIEPRVNHACISD